MRLPSLWLAVVTVALLPYQPAVAQGPPSLPIVRRGACPFECCQYGRWVARASIPVFAAERSMGDTVGMLAPGEAIEALDGTHHVLRAAVAVFQRPYNLVATIHDTLAIQPGDTVYVLDHIGEGVFHVWYRGKPYQMDQQWAYPDDDAPIRAAARALADMSPKTEWWVRIRRRTGAEGWILEDPTGPARFEGSDACGEE